jgi:5-methylcytosine-specific restriction enzyme B
LSTAHREDAAHIYAILERWVADCLVEDGSLFTPDRRIWTLAGFEELRRAFTEHPDESSDPFLTKLRRQLADENDLLVQLFAELLYVHLLVAQDIGGAAKRDNLTAVLELMGHGIELDQELDAGLDHGLVTTGVAYKTYRPFQLWLFIDVCIAIKRLEPERRRELLLEDPRGFKDLLFSVEHEAAYTQQHALLHLVYPDYYEDIVSRDHKERIRRGFDDLVPPGTDDIDEALRAIRTALEDGLADPSTSTTTPTAGDGIRS